LPPRQALSRREETATLHIPPPSLDRRTARQPGRWRIQVEKVAPFLMEIDNCR
jgi:hypothetical protein